MTRGRLLAVAVGIAVAIIVVLSVLASGRTSPGPNRRSSRLHERARPRPRPCHRSTTTPAESVADPTSLSALLARLVVAPEHLEGYERDLFPHRDDTDGNGCNTRYEVLIATAVVAPTIAGKGCDLTGGSWLSPYDGLVIEGSSGVQIDHVVALAEAWYSGADAWTTEQRERFANDLGVPWALTVASARSQRSQRLQRVPQSGFHRGSRPSADMSRRGSGSRFAGVSRSMRSNGARCKTS